MHTKVHEAVHTATLTYFFFVLNLSNGLPRARLGLLLDARHHVRGQHAEMATMCLTLRSS
ncbi:hypothetical protein H6CHR_04713 [Variovorax sp. PBL-H6]|nr:hypothetical protein H6CHR_04713 [Variovorax sp. PBL-H6]